MDFDSIPHSSSSLGQEECIAAQRTIDDNFVGSGPVVRKLIDRFLVRTTRRFGFAVLSGTQALILSLQALHLEPGSKVAVPILTCPSILMAVKGAGYLPLLVDIEKKSLTIDPGKIPEDTRCIIAPHAYGHPINAVVIRELGIPWIEDCATSPTTVACGKIAGSHGTVAIFSLNSTKYFTGGSGGILVTDDSLLVDRITDLLDCHTPLHTELWNYDFAVNTAAKLPDLNASVALAQFDKLELFHKKRREIADQYLAGLSGLQHVELPGKIVGHGYYRFILHTDISAQTIENYLLKKGIDARSSVNTWLDSLSGTVRFEEGAWPVADYWRSNLLSLPIYPGLNAVQIEYIVRNVHAAIEKNNE